MFQKLKAIYDSIPKSAIRLVLVAVGILIAINLAIWIFTRKPTISPESKKTLDELALDFKKLEQKQIKDSIKIASFQDSIQSLNKKIQDSKSQVTIIKEHYYEQIPIVTNFSNADIDNFFSKRYPNTK